MRRLRGARRRVGSRRWSCSIRRCSTGDDCVALAEALARRRTWSPDVHGASRRGRARSQCGRTAASETRRRRPAGARRGRSRPRRAGGAGDGRPCSRTCPATRAAVLTGEVVAGAGGRDRVGAGRARHELLACRGRRRRAHGEGPRLGNAGASASSPRSCTLAVSDRGAGVLALARRHGHGPVPRARRPSERHSVREPVDAERTANGVRDAAVETRRRRPRRRSRPTPSSR